MPEQTNGIWRLVTIDGPQVVCTDSTGDLPLFMAHIDPTKCSFADVAGVPIEPTKPVVTLPPNLPTLPSRPIVGVPDTPVVTPPVAAIPEPETWALLLAGALLLGWRRARARGARP